MGSDRGSDLFPGAQQPAALAEAPGTLTVFSRVPMDIYIAGKRVGSTESGPIILPPGVHRVELVSERLNYRGTASLNIRPAAVTSHTVTLPNGRLQVNTEPGAQVSIEGKPMGVAPFAEVVPVRRLGVTRNVVNVPLTSTAGMSKVGTGMVWLVEEFATVIVW